MKSVLKAEIPTAGSAYDVLHGYTVEDPFRWLEDQDSPETRAFLSRQSDCYQDYLGRHAALRERIRSRVFEFLTLETRDLPVPDRRGGMFYLMRKAGEERMSVHHQDRDGDSRLLVPAGNFEAHASIAILDVSRSGRYLVLGMRIGGAEFQEIEFYDVVHGHLSSDRLAPGLCRGLAFSEEEACVFYSKEDTEGPYQHRRAVRRHRLGDSTTEDQEVFYAGEGPGLRLILKGAVDTHALAYLLVPLDGGHKTTLFVHDAPFDAQPHAVASLRGNAFGPLLFEDWVEAVTTLDAPRGRVVRFALSSPGRSSTWTTLLPEAPEQLFAYIPMGNLRLAHTLSNGRKMTHVYSLHGELQRAIDYPQGGTVVLGSVDTFAQTLFYSHSDVESPPSIFRVDLATGKHRLWWRQEAPVLPTSRLRQEEHEYRSVDGTMIPLTLFGAGDRKSPSPVLLTAYGASASSSTPRFSVLTRVLAEAGVLSVIAHVRGGGEHGVDWHEAACGSRKQTSVDDLMCAAHWLIRKGYAGKGGVGLAGQSYGALLALCALTQRPQLFRAVLALGPIADLTRFHLFGAARNFVGELGSPEDAVDFPALLRLSPYHHVQDHEHYPAVLIVSGDQDQRCDALHARKMTARLQAIPEPNGPILLDYNAIRGHKPVLSLQSRVDGLTDRLTFLIAELVGDRESTA